MTEGRLQKIIDEISDNGTRIMRPHMVMKAMKQAVNEVLEEAVEKADVGIKSGDHSVFNLHVLYKEKDNYEVDKQSIINLKVK